MTAWETDLCADFKGQLRRWTLTCWDDPTKVQIPEGTLTYFLAVREECPTTKKVHWQSYLETSGKVTIAKMRKIFGNIRCFVSKGTGSQNVSYCKKGLLDSTPPEHWREYGELMVQGARTDLREAKRKLDANEITIEGLLDEEPALYMRYRNGWRDIIKAKMKYDSVGRPDAVGETINVSSYYHAYRLARSYHNAFILPKNGMWDEYMGESCVLVIVEFGTTTLPEWELQIPLHRPLPSKYNTVYPCWSRYVRINVTGNVTAESLPDNS